MVLDSGAGVRPGKAVSRAGDLSTGRGLGLACDG